MCKKLSRLIILLQVMTFNLQTKKAASSEMTAPILEEIMGHCLKASLSIHSDKKC